MKIIQSYKADLLNGVGLRNVYFFSGCHHKCFNCFNAETQDPNMPLARKWTEEDFERLIRDASEDYIDGITLSGGDPLSIWNMFGIQDLCQQFKERLPNKSIWCYTGYRFEQLIALGDKDPRKTVLKYIDVLCDGRFIQSKASPTKPWVGSENQRVIDVQASIRNNQIVLF